MYVQERNGACVYDFLLYTCLGIFLIAQFPSAIIDLARWFSLPAVGLLFACLIWDQKLGQNPVAIGIGLVAIYTMATSFVSYYPTISYMKSVSLLLLAGFLLVVPPALQLLYPGVGAREHLLRMYMYFAVVIVISNAGYYFLMPGDSNDFLSGTSFLDGRFRGWFINPNDIAAVYGMFFVPILWYEISRNGTGTVRLGLFLTLLLAAIQLFASQSRAGISAGVVSLLVLTLGHRKGGARTIIVAMIGLVVLAMFISKPGDNLIISFIYRNETKLQGSGRFPVWAATWNRFLDKPFLGSGLGVANTGASVGGLAFTTGKFSIEKGNSYLGALEELGSVGIAILVIALLAPILRACWDGMSIANPPVEESNLVLIAIVAAGLVDALFEAWLLSVGSFLGLSFWVFASLLLYKRGGV
jgi:O-antigen ligase